MNTPLPESYASEPSPPASVTDTAFLANDVRLVESTLIAPLDMFIPLLPVK